MLCFEASAAQLTMACAFASLCLSPGITKKSVFCRHRSTQGQNNKHRQGEAGRCWIHFHGTYHCCRGASKLCVLGRLNTKRYFLFLPVFLFFLVYIPSNSARILSPCLHWIKFSVFQDYKSLNSLFCFFFFLLPWLNLWYSNGNI